MLRPDPPSPPPHWGASAQRWLDWHTRHIPTVAEFARLLERMECEGLVTSAEALAHADRPAVEVVAELAAKARAVDAIGHEAGEHRDR